MALNFKNHANIDPSNIIGADLAKSVSGNVEIIGKKNAIEIMAGATLKCDIKIEGDNNSIIIGAGCVVRGRILVKGNGQRVSIGDGTTFQSVYILCQEGCNVDIGRWCMFSRDIEVRTTDAHSVVEVATGQRINKPASIFVGDHVWVSVGALISKGASIPEDSIVGAFSFVNRAFMEKNTIIAGAPAKAVKAGVTWNRSRKDKFSDEELNFWKKIS